ncbi:MAG: hypothetical protein OXN89_09360 [Bryobacterales bacterium]|nr:hypothetical protein [Bryobacterales bacterium]
MPRGAAAGAEGVLRRTAPTLGRGADAGMHGEHAIIPPVGRDANRKRVRNYSTIRASDRRPRWSHRPGRLVTGAQPDVIFAVESSLPKEV